MIHITTAPALLIGIGARLILDHFTRSDGPFVKDFILVGTWQGVALHYATKTSGLSGFGIIVAFGIAAKLFIEFNFSPDVMRCATTILGVALGVLFTDLLSQYLDKPRALSSRRRKRSSSVTQKPERKERLVQFRPSTQGATSTTITDLTDAGDASHVISDITSVDSNSDRIGPISSLSPVEREIHILRTRASLADSERRRLKEERKWAISQGNLARASQMKWEVKRYTALMQTFNQEASLKEEEGNCYLARSDYRLKFRIILPVANSQKNVSSHSPQSSTTAKDKTPRINPENPLSQPTHVSRLPSSSNGVNVRPTRKSSSKRPLNGKGPTNG
ncbi:hypothetical protein BJ165DRAFT_1525261 [Panaeolus papilionaceus]|nr:hypothetical protein BJ165DRAFT_1525261 [Panaeolus papilionaceus]